MDKLEASLKTITICSSLIEKSTYTAGVVFDSRKMIRDGILATVNELLEIVKELEKEEDQ
jgi:Ethanolamine utilization protein EutJ (predicted chaperonin)